MADAQANFRIGSRLVLFGGTNLGQTGEDTTVTIEKELVDITGDATGNTLVDQAIMGMKITASITLKQWSKADLTDIIANVLAENTAATADRIDVADQTNEFLGTNAATLVLRARNAAADGTTAIDEEFIIWKAVANVVGEINYNNTEQVGVTVEFTGLIDPTNGLYTYGDSTT